jgi:hypothetical protein
MEPPPTSTITERAKEMGRERSWKLSGTPFDAWGYRRVRKGVIERNAF